MAKKSGATAALKVLDKAGIDYIIRRYVHDPSSPLGYGREAAQALHMDPSTIFKTLMVAVDGQPTVVIVPVDSRVSLKNLARACSAKNARMISPDDAQRLTGYIVGGISPLGQKKKFPTVIDVSAKELSRINISGGRRGLDVELAVSDLAALTEADFADIKASSHN
ncbi:MAG: Cys-tRNA(Pro) deacylase [Actinomycetaceae bacterium]|nr:Cys-tRNA(Pro) deacylase [Actinomycetaceae bacterium]